MIQEYYRQMRKFGCNILAVVQQYDVLKASDVRGAMIGNSKMFLKQRAVWSRFLPMISAEKNLRPERLASSTMSIYCGARSIQS